MLCGGGEGIQRTWFEQKTDFQLDALVGTALREFVEHDLMLDQNGRVQLTRKGLMVSDTLFNRLLTRGPSDGGLAARKAVRLEPDPNA